MGINEEREKGGDPFKRGERGRDVVGMGGGARKVWR